MNTNIDLGNFIFFTIKITLSNLDFTKIQHEDSTSISTRWCPCCIKLSNTSWEILFAKKKYIYFFLYIYTLTREINSLALMTNPVHTVKTQITTKTWSLEKGWDLLRGELFCQYPSHNVNILTYSILKKICCVVTLMICI